MSYSTGQAGQAEMLWLANYTAALACSELEDLMGCLDGLGKTEAHAYVLRSLVGLNKLSKLLQAELDIVRNDERSAAWFDAVIQFPNSKGEE